MKEKKGLKKMRDSQRLGVMMEVFCMMKNSNGVVHAGDYHKTMRKYGHPVIRHLLVILVEAGAIKYTKKRSGDDAYKLKSVEKWELQIKRLSDKE